MSLIPSLSSPRATTLVLVAAVVGVGAFALLRPDAQAVSPANAETTRVATADTSMPALPPTSGGSLLPPVNENQALPPGHPDIGSSGGAAAQAGMAPANTDAASITWKAPGGWTVVPNPSAMRLATYRAPRATGATDDADLAVTRAGGSTDANIDRWLGQFDAQGRGKETRTEKTVHGLKVTLVEVSGTYLSGAMMQGAPASKPGWTLLAAIVEAPGMPYFFKMTGPSTSITAARASFTTMIDGVTPS